MSWALDAGQTKKFTALFNDLAAKAGGVSELEKSAAGLSLSGLAVDTLMSIWRLSDMDGNDRLSLSEYLICCSLIAYCVRTKQPPPPQVPAELRSSAIAAAENSAGNTVAPDAWSLDEAQISKYGALFDDLAAKAGSTLLEKSAAGLSLSGLPIDVLLKIWALSDGKLSIESTSSLPLPCSLLLGYAARSDAPRVMPPLLQWTETID